MFMFYVHTIPVKIHSFFQGVWIIYTILNKWIKSGVELKNENQKWIIELGHIRVNDVGFGFWVGQRWLSVGCPFSSIFSLALVMSFSSH
jgi:hypothetical protein